VIGRIVDAGRGFEFRMAISFLRQRKNASNERKAAATAIPIANETIRYCGPRSAANCSSTTPLARIARDVRIQARNVLSLAYEKR